MKISEIEIKHFRSIKHSQIRMADVCCLVGENSAGKSTVLRALNTFFNFNMERRYFSSGQHFYSRHAQPQITVTFQSESPPEGLKKFFADGIFKVRLSYIRSEGRPRYHQIKRSSKTELRIRDRMLIFEHIFFTLIPPVRDHSRILDAENGVLQQLISAYLKNQTKNRDQISPAVRKAAKGIELGVFKKISAEIEKLYFLNNEFKFALEFKDSIDYRHLIHDYKLKVQEHSRSFELEDCGNGIQSLTLIALYRYLAKLKNSNYILGIEEPETNLHPQAQRDFVNSVKSTPNHSEIGRVQTIFSTHSPVIVDQLDHEDIVLCTRKADSKRGFKCEHTQIDQSFWEVNDIEESKNYQFYRYRNSEFFFSKHVILCEGKSDAEVIRKLASEISIDLDALGVSVLETGGVGSFKYPVALFEALNMPYTAVVDKDFFVPLLNGELNSSRDTNGFPVYKDEFEPNHLKIIERVFKTKGERERLLQQLSSNHKKAMTILEQKNWVVFRWTLETDLINSVAARTEYFKMLNIKPEFQSAKTLLLENSKAIKRTDYILKVLETLPASNLPSSYARIKKILKKLKASVRLQSAPIALTTPITVIAEGTDDTQPFEGFDI